MDTAQKIIGFEIRKSGDKGFRIALLERNIAEAKLVNEFSTELEARQWMDKAIQDGTYTVEAA